MTGSLSLRTIVAFEHEHIPVIPDERARRLLCEDTPGATWLSETEAAHLEALNKLRPGFCRRTASGIKLAQYCGIVRLGPCVLEVLPKIGLADDPTHQEAERARAALLSMLSAAKRLSLTEPGQAPQHVAKAPLLDVFIEAFLDTALAQARRGLLSRYVGQADDVRVLKGRFAAHAHVRRNHSRPQLFHCEYEEFSPDNPYNRAVRATLRACRTWISRTSTQRKWFEVQTRFAAVTELPMSAADVRRLPRDRTNHRYESLLRWCTYLLDMQSPLLKAGHAHAPALLFDMNKLFEAYVARQYETEAEASQIVIRNGPARSLAMCDGTPVFSLEPDITVWNTSAGGKRADLVRIADAKWKWVTPNSRDWGIEGADMYQLLAYALRYDCRRLELVYPRPAKAGSSSPAFQVPDPRSDETITITLRTLPLWQG
jgi:5-methylcytosine-specific restriction enzyme subunit McrC